MGISKWLAMIVAALLAMSSAALTDQSAVAGATEAAKPLPSTVGSAAETPRPTSTSHTRVNESRVLCLKRVRTGSRLAKRRCQSIAAWRTELQDERLRKYLLEL
ncbi:MAG: hypothetical protein AAF465_03335 [Pseudomonadota bacterium]